MNIKQAKEQIKFAIKSYFTKNEFGEFEIPIESQRPIFLMGPPGIGKTAIMQQISQELNVGLVSYSMTHHTRQSAIGLPFIVHKTYCGQEFDVSEYTMSEIIASVYEMMENDGVKEGILFLDEINCVSETLAPSMLQFLQYKIFGKHRIPNGWIVVTAGNPPEYNNSVREFDIVTWDRLKRIDIEPDFDTWKEYAYNKGIHPAITTYLEVKKKDFYLIETTVDGKSFVTARGWVDLSDMIKLYERNNFKVDEQLIAQYIQNKKITKEFSIYYDLFNKYRSDYQVDKILNGEYSDTIVNRAKKSKFDERLALLGLLIDMTFSNVTGVIQNENMMRTLMNEIKKIQKGIDKKTSSDVAEILRNTIEIIEDTTQKGIHSGKLSKEMAQSNKRVVNILNNMVAEILKQSDRKPFDIIKELFNKENENFKKKTSKVCNRLENLFKFCETAFGNDAQEILILVTELTINNNCADFIRRYGCMAYFKHNKELLFYERQKDIIQEIENFNLNDFNE